MSDAVTQSGRGMRMQRETLLRQGIGHGILSQHIEHAAGGAGIEREIGEHVGIGIVGQNLGHGGVETGGTGERAPHHGQAIAGQMGQPVVREGETNGAVPLGRGGGGQRVMRGERRENGVTEIGGEGRHIQREGKHRIITPFSLAPV